MKHILVVEDEPTIRSSLKRLLTRNHYIVQEAGSVQEACDNFQLTDFQLVITDVRLPGEEGTVLIERAKPTPVLIMTSFGEIRSAVDAIKKGAVNYIAKPFDHDEMLLAVAKALNQQSDAPALLESGAKASGGSMIGSSAVMQKVFKLIERVAPMDTTVLIRGESGTGKELVARAIHEKSPRHDGPLIPVNCAAIPENLIESELFGYEKGAFTGAVTQRKGLVEAADGGTLFLDEIGELPLEAQARLLRVLQEKEIRRVGSTQAKTLDFRLVAATHRDLKKWVAEGRFREDLYYRLNVMEVQLPPLRDRENDILEIADVLLAKKSEKFSNRLFRFSVDARDAIVHYPWPGNIRELENLIERAMILSDNDEITPSDLSIEHIESKESAHTFSPSNISSASGDAQSPSSLEDYFVQFVLDNQDKLSETELASRLGISRKSLWERRQRLGIPRK